MWRRRLAHLGLLVECLALVLGGAAAQAAPEWGAHGPRPAAGRAMIPPPTTTAPPDFRRQVAPVAPVNPLAQIALLSSSLSTVNAASQRLATSLSQAQAAASSIAASAASAVSDANNAAAAAMASASQAVASASQVAATASQMAASASQMASEAASLAASSVQASASSAVASAIMMANSASSSASSALAAASVAMAEATSVRAQADTQVQQAQGSAVSVTQAAIAVVGAIIVSALLTLAGFYLFIRYRKTKLKEQEEENFAHEQANAALDRAVLSYMGKGSSYGPYSEYAPSEAGDRARSVMMNRPNTADKSAIPGMGVFSLALRDPAKPPSKGQPLDKVEEVAPEAPKAEKVDEKGERVTSEEWNSRRASNWPFARQP